MPKNAKVILSDDVKAAGAATWWSLSGSVPYDALAQAWGAAGLDARLLPNAVGIGTALQRAVHDCAEQHLLARTLPDGDGWELVRVSTIEGEGRRRHRYEVEVEARVVETPEGKAIEVSPEGHHLRGAIVSGVRTHMATLLAIDVGKWLVHLAEMLHAVPLRASGGFYFIPRESLSMWQVICRTVEQAAPHTVWMMPALRSDEAVAAILQSVAEEVRSRAAKLREELQSGELGERALRTRMERAREATHMVHSYKEILGDRLVDLTATLEAVYRDIGEAVQRLEAGLPPLDPSVAIEVEAPPVPEDERPTEVRVERRAAKGGAK